MNILAFDTETTGLPSKRAVATLESQPHVIQLAASLFSAEDRRPIFEFSVLVKPPKGVLIPEVTTAVHGITTQEAVAFGVEKKTALALLRHACLRADVVIAHNAEFDMKLISFEAERVEVGHPVPSSLVQCTCDLATPIVNLPPTERMLQFGRTGPKRAKLEECFQHFFGESLAGAHDALVDTRGCARVYFHLLDNGLIK